MRHSDGRPFIFGFNYGAIKDDDDAGALGAHTRAELAQTRGAARADVPMPFSTPSPIPSTVPAPPTYRTCAVCRRPTASPWSPYCARCRGHLHDRPENAKRRKALVAAYDPGLDGFRCSYSGAPLEEEDQADPFYLYFDHEVPRRSSRLVACGAERDEVRAVRGRVPQGGQGAREA